MFKSFLQKRITQILLSGLGITPPNPRGHLILSMSSFYLENRDGGGGSNFHHEPDKVRHRHQDRHDHPREDERSLILKQKNHTFFFVCTE